MDHIFQFLAEPLAGYFRVLPGKWQEHANHGRDERRALSRIRQGRKVSFLHSQHGRRIKRELAGSFWIPAAGLAQRVRSGAEEDRREPGGTAERRRKSRGEEGRGEG